MTGANKTCTSVDTFHEETAELSGSFDHYDAGHDGSAGDVPPDPELTFRDIFEAESESFVQVVPYNAIKL